MKLPQASRVTRHFGATIGWSFVLTIYEERWDRRKLGFRVLPALCRL